MEELIKTYKIYKQIDDDFHLPLLEKYKFSRFLDLKRLQNPDQFKIWKDNHDKMILCIRELLNFDINAMDKIK